MRVCRASRHDRVFPTHAISLQLSKKDHGEYKATLKDERGQDLTVLEIGGKGKTKPSLFPKETRVTDGRRVALTPRSGALATVRIVVPAEAPGLHFGCLRSRVGV